MDSTLKSNLITRQAWLLFVTAAAWFAAASVVHAANTGSEAASSLRATPGPVHDTRASRLIGSEVRNPYGKDLGKIEDLIVDINSERVRYAILSFGGFLGMGDKLFAYPLSAFEQEADGDRLILNISENRLKASPGFRKDRYPDWLDRRDTEAIDRLDERNPAPPPEVGVRPRRASELMGMEVKGIGGEKIGKIEDLVVNMQSGNIHYTVFAFDQLWDVTNKTILIALRTFNLESGGSAILNVDREKLDHALDFEKNRWPNVNNPLFLVDVDGYLVLVDPQEYSEEGSAAAVFKRLDVNRDNKLTQDEARQDGKVFGSWTQFDPRGAGVVTREEFLSSYKSLIR